MTRLAWTMAVLPLALAAAPAETDAIQRRIDAAAAAGGGTVTICAGDHEVGGLYLRSNVTLELAKGARLVASTNSMDYAGFPDCPGQRAVVTGWCVTNAALAGMGEIDGRGWSMLDRKLKSRVPNRWKDVVFCRSKDVRVEGVTLRDPASWTCYFMECDGVTVRNVTIRSLVNHNNDGIDIEARNVLVEDCDIIAEDDAICFKSDNPAFAVENCTVRRCRVSSNCNFIKFGTSSFGAFRNVLVEDCEAACRGVSGLLRWHKYIPGVTGEQTGLAGIALEVVDGGTMEDVTVRNITIGAGVQTPIFIRQGRRRAPAVPDRPSVLRRILVENVKATAPAASRIACSITGVPGLRPRDITLRNIDLVFPGGGTAEDVRRPVPEVEDRYPENWMFGKSALPGWAFYVRHADNVRFEKVRCSLAADDARRAVLVDDAEGVTFDGCDFNGDAYVANSQSSSPGCSPCK